MTDYVEASQTYVDSYAVYRRGLLEQQQVWMATKVIPDMKKNSSVGKEDTLNILAFGSGFGEVDVLFLKELKKQFTEKEGSKIVYTVVERNEEFVRIFKDRVKTHGDELKNVEFVWVLQTCEEFLSAGEFVANSFHIVHFLHVLYYVDVPTVLKQCMARLLSSSGCLFMVVQSPGSLYSKNIYRYDGKIDGAWVNVKLVTDKDLIALAEENQWRNVSFNGDRKMDITDIFQPNSPEGGMLIDFFFHSDNLPAHLEASQLQDIKDFFKSNSVSESVAGSSRSFANADEGIVLYYKS